MLHIATLTKECKRRLAAIIVVCLVASPFIVVALSLLQLSQESWTTERTNITYSEFKSLSDNNLSIDPIGAESICWVEYAARGVYDDFLRVKISENSAKMVIERLRKKIISGDGFKEVAIFENVENETRDGSRFVVLDFPQPGISAPSWWGRVDSLKCKYSGKLAFEAKTKTLGWEWKYNSQDGELYVREWAIARNTRR